VSDTLVCPDSTAVRIACGAGDANDFAVKHGRTAEQQADLTTQAIAALTGLAHEPESLRPMINRLPLTRDRLLASAT
jgi:hypothetical protein